uniref:Uncharacterized protein n=1 Tax=Lepeophtheirus salmonis TaxID=72036 RepID=A0A0K2VI04_LEPSM
MTFNLSLKDEFCRSGMTSFFEFMALGTIARLTWYFLVKYLIGVPRDDFKEYGSVILSLPDLWNVLSYAPSSSQWL